MLIKDRYRLETVLGQGGMGEVWRARDELLGRLVAVKLLSHQESDETAAARFTMEARTAGRLSHPNTVAVYDFGSVGDRLYLVMELVAGHSLATEIAAFGRLDPRQVALWGGQAAAGLAAAHREHIVHRDIKPSNLLVTGDGMLKIGDFGIAHFAHQSSAGVTSTGMIIGTASYLAPERALGRTSGPPSDMYALGCVLYELLAGRPPFVADSPTGLLHQHVQVPPDDVRGYRDDVPDALAGLVHHLLAKEPGDRPTADQVVAGLAGPTRRMNAVVQGAGDPAGHSATRTMPSVAEPGRAAGAPRARAARSSRRLPLIATAAAAVLAATAIGMSMADSDSSAAPAPTTTSPTTEPEPTVVTPTAPAPAAPATPSHTAPAHLPPHHPAPPPPHPERHKDGKGKTPPHHHR